MGDTSSCMRGTKLAEQLMVHNDKECDKSCPAFKRLREVVIAHWLQNITTRDLYLCADTVAMARAKDPGIDPLNWKDGKPPEPEDA